MFVPNRLEDSSYPQMPLEQLIESADYHCWQEDTTDNHVSQTYVLHKFDSSENYILRAGYHLAIP